MRVGRGAWSAVRRNARRRSRGRIRTVAPRILHAPPYQTYSTRHEEEDGLIFMPAVHGGLPSFIVKAESAPQSCDFAFMRAEIKIVPVADEHAAVGNDFPCQGSCSLLPGPCSYRSLNKQPRGLCCGITRLHQRELVRSFTGSIDRMAATFPPLEIIQLEALEHQSSKQSICLALLGAPFLSVLAGRHAFTIKPRPPAFGMP